MAGAPMFQAVQHPEVDTLGIVAIRNFLKKRARYLRLLAQNNKADGVNVTPITVVASIDPELVENLIDMEEIDAESVDDCTNESVMEYLESTQERSVSVTVEYVEAEVLAEVSFTMSEKESALRVTKGVADYYSLHRNLRLDFISGKPKEAVEHLVFGHPQGSDREQTRDGQVGTQEGLPRVCWLSQEDGDHTRRALSCCETEEDWRLWHDEHWQKQRRWQPQF
jgi:hypothetical protein